MKLQVVFMVEIAYLLLMHLFLSAYSEPGKFLVNVVDDYYEIEKSDLGRF